MMIMQEVNNAYCCIACSYGYSHCVLIAVVDRSAIAIIVELKVTLTVVFNMLALAVDLGIAPSLSLL